MARIITEKEKEEIILRTIKGQTMVSICLALDIPRHAITYLKNKDPIFANKLKTSREEATHDKVESLSTICDDVTDLIGVNVARIKSDNIKWTAGKILPHEYGDKMQLDVNQRIDIGPALEAMHGRMISALEMRSTVKVLDSQAKDVTNQAAGEVVAVETGDDFEDLL